MLHFYLLAAQIVTLIIISILLWQIIHFLKRILYFNFSGDSISDNLTKIFLHTFTNYKNNFIKSSFDRIMNRIVHDNLTVRTE